MNAATELGLLIIASFEENDRAVDEARLSQLKKIAEAMTPGVEMSEYLRRAIKWVDGTGHLLRKRPLKNVRLRLSRNKKLGGRCTEVCRTHMCSIKKTSLDQLSSFLTSSR